MPETIRTKLFGVESFDVWEVVFKAETIEKIQD